MLLSMNLKTICMATSLQNKKTVLIIIISTLVFLVVLFLYFASLFNSGVERIPNTISECEKNILKYKSELRKLDSLCENGDTNTCKFKEYYKIQVEIAIHNLDSIKMELLKKSGHNN